MSQLVDQLLELARFESGTVRPLMVEFEINTVIIDCFKRLEYIAAEKNISFRLTTLDPFIVKADISMTTIVIENILSNAVKYSPDNQSVEVHLRNESGSIQCLISDHGSGIPEDQYSKVFHRFYRVDESRTSQTAGKGIGLAIVKRLAEIQQLGISIHSTPSSGTTFTISFA